jgi:hypothetical protein
VRKKWLLIRDQTGDIFLINSRNNGTATEIALTLAAHGCQNVAGEGASALDAAGRRFFETFCSTTVCFDLWHNKYSFFDYSYN